MKNHFRLFLLFITLCFVQSCTKETVTTNTGLIGKWKLTEAYSGYFNGGTFLWQPVLDSNSNTLEFTADGFYTKQENASGNFQKCTGTYQANPDSTINVQSTCSIEPETLKVTELTSNHITISYGVIEGEILYKYEATK